MIQQFLNMHRTIENKDEHQWRSPYQILVVSLFINLNLNFGVFELEQFDLLHS
jgi:hypothetical protein